MQTLLGSNLCWLSSGGNCLPCKVAARVFRSPVRHSLLKVIMSASQHFEALVYHRKDRTAPASGLPQQSLPDLIANVTLHDTQSPKADLQTGFDHQQFYSHLPTQTHLGQTLITAGQLQSTQTLLQENAAVIPDNTVCIAFQQVGGKGRGGNTWESPAGCLMFSLLKRVSIKGQNLPFVQYIATLAIVQAVQQLAQQKLQVVTGVGLNLDNSQPTTCINDILRQQHTELQQQDTLQPITREELLACILQRLQGLLETLVADGFGPLQEAYLHAWLHTNQQVTLVEHGGQEVALTIRGLTEYGYLLAVDCMGTAFALHPDGNSLDFFKGLIRHKLS